MVLPPMSTTATSVIFRVALFPIRCTPRYLLAINKTPSSAAFSPHFLDSRIDDANNKHNADKNCGAPIPSVRRIPYDHDRKSHHACANDCISMAPDFSVAVWVLGHHFCPFGRTERCNISDHAIAIHHIAFSTASRMNQ